MDRNHKFNQTIRACMGIMMDHVSNESDREAFRSCLAIISAIIANIITRVEIPSEMEIDSILLTISEAAKITYFRAEKQIKKNEKH